MQTVKELLNKEEVIDSISIYAYGFERYNKFLQPTIVECNNKELIELDIKHKDSISNWGQGDLKVTIHQESRLVEVFRREIDSEDWGHSWYKKLYLKEINIDTLIEKNKPLLPALSLLKEVKNSYEEQKKSLEEENKFLKEKLISNTESSASLIEMLNKSLASVEEENKLLNRKITSSEKENILLNKKLAGSREQIPKSLKKLHYIPVLSDIKGKFVKKKWLKEINKNEVIN